jgi:hypothetical protein
MDTEVLVKRGVAMLAFTLIPTALFAPLPIDPWLGWRWDSRTFRFHATPIATLSPEPRPAPAERPPASAGVRELATLGVDDTRALQRALMERGVYRGPLNGVAGDETILALLRLETQRCESRLEAIRQGRLSEASRAELVPSP